MEPSGLPSETYQRLRCRDAAAPKSWQDAKSLSLHLPTRRSTHLRHPQKASAVDKLHALTHHLWRGGGSRGPEEAPYELSLAQKREAQWSRARCPHGATPSF